MSSHSSGNKYVFILQEFSIPLLLGVVAALVVSNVAPDFYSKVVDHTYEFFVKVDHKDDGHGHEGDKHDHDDGHAHDDKKSNVSRKVLPQEDGDQKGDAPDDQAKNKDQDKDKSKAGNDSHDDDGDDAGEHSKDGHAKGEKHDDGHDLLHFFTMHFFVNEIFMVIFFGIAAKEITESCLPGGALNPVKKAINPLLGTIGGVLGPVGVYFLLTAVMGEAEWYRGWGIPTATDIALAWLIARLVFGNGHPAISFLLLLAVADDGIGLMIIAFFYPKEDPVWLNVLWVIPGMLTAFALRARNVRSWVPYIVIGGAFSWWGLFSAHLHPALALVPIVPFLPAGKKDDGFFKEEAGEVEDNPLDRFEHDLKLIVDFGLFFFAFANAGVQFSNISGLTWIVLLSLIIGKTIGITLFSWGGALVGIPLPSGMKLKHLVVAGVVAGLGLTVALFVSGQAFASTDPNQGAAKMGALFSASAAIIALILGRVLGLKEGNPANESESKEAKKES